MIIGSVILIFVCHVLVPIINNWVFAIALILLLGVGFSLVPSAMWPSVPKIILKNNLNCLRAYFLGSKLGIDGRTCIDWLGA